MPVTDELLIKKLIFFFVNLLKSLNTTKFLRIEVIFDRGFIFRCDNRYHCEEVVCLKGVNNEKETCESEKK